MQVLFEFGSYSRAGSLSSIYSILFVLCIVIPCLDVQNNAVKEALSANILAGEQPFEWLEAE